MQHQSTAGCAGNFIRTRSLGLMAQTWQALHMQLARLQAPIWQLEQGPSQTVALPTSMACLTRGWMQREVPEVDTASGCNAWSSPFGCPLPGASNHKHHMALRSQHSTALYSPTQHCQAQTFQQVADAQSSRQGKTDTGCTLKFPAANHHTRTMLSLCTQRQQGGNDAAETTDKKNKTSTTQSSVIALARCV